MTDAEILERAMAGECRADGSSFRVLVNEARRLKAERDALLAWNIRPCGGEFTIVGLWCSPGGVFATRKEADDRLIAFALSTYGPAHGGEKPCPE